MDSRHARKRDSASVLGALVLSNMLIAALTVSPAHGETEGARNCGANPGDARGSAQAVDAGGETGSSTARNCARLLSANGLIIPVVGVSRARLRDTFDESRGARRHEAIDFAAPVGTPVVAAGDGRVAKLFSSVPGGLTVYQFDPDENFAYYYAHLAAYAVGLSEGATLTRGDLLGYVGVTGNAAADAPHLHFAVFRLGPDRKWWEGEAVNPYPYLNDADR